jgi:branched-chain amino acid transport system substrate-binding protein
MAQENRRVRNGFGAIGAILCAALATLIAAPEPGAAAEPIKLGIDLGMTGANGPTSGQILLSLQIWRDDVNAKGGLLGRPVEIVYYDDQTNPANVPGNITKLIDVDRVELMLGPYGTNLIAAAIPIIMQHSMTTVGILGLAANSAYHYPRYFSMIPTGPNPKIAFSEDFFNLAMAQNPKPKMVAIVGADAEFGKTATDGARENAKAAGLTIVYDQRYPPSTVDFSPIVRAIQATNPDIVFIASYPTDSVNMIRAVNEVGLEPKMIGGAMIGLLVNNLKMQLGPAINGFVQNEVFVPGPTFNFPGVQELLKKYQAQAPSLHIDPLGYSFAPLAYAAAQVMADAVEATKGLDQSKLAEYIRAHSFDTVMGHVTFGPDGEWAKPRLVFFQFQHLAVHDLDQFRDTTHQVILAPPEYKTGTMIYPFADARK